jgi:N-acetylglucosaminyl-diphospho-decaprenol L-rhamnosyltransferase
VTKVLFVTYSGAFGGAERVLLDCAAALDGQHLLACPPGALAEHAGAAGLTVIELPERGLRVRGRARHRVLGPTRLLGHALEVRRLAGALDPDLVVAWGMRSGIAGLALERSRAFALEHHDFLPSPAIGAVIRHLAGRAAVVTVPSQAVATDLDPHGRLGDRVRVVFPGVDAEHYVSTGPAPADAPVLVLGAIAPWKRPDLALEICALARSELPGLRLRLVGTPVTPDEPLWGELTRRADHPDLRGAVDMPGAQADPRAELAGASCLLHCAPREPFGIVLLEALAAGRPVVAPNAAGPTEIVDKTCGVLYAPGDAAAGAAALMEVLRDPERAVRMGEAGRERVRARFGREQTRRGYAAALGPLLGGGSVGSTPESGPGQDRGLAQDGGLALLTVSHNSAAELQTLIDSVRSHLPGAALTVVDCASSDESVAVAERSPGVHVIALGENLGFGRACNRGLRELTAPVTALVNPDVELIDDSLLLLASEARRQDRPERLLAPLVLNPDGSRQETAHPVPSSSIDLIRALVPPGLLPGPAGAALAPWRSRSPRRVGWAVGAALVARTETLRRLGPFDETIFMYGEDLELGLRAAEQGVETWFWPQARVRHQGAHSSDRAFGGEPFELLAQARHDVMVKRFGARRAQLDDSAQAATFASRLILKRALGRPAERERRQLAALRSLERRSR